MPMINFKNRQTMNRFNCGRSFARSFYAFKDGDSGDGGGKSDEDKYTLEEAREKLTKSGWSVMKQEALDGIIKDKYTDAYAKAKKELADPKGTEEYKALEKERKTLEAKIKELEKENPDMISKSEHENILGVSNKKLEERDREIEKLKGHQLESAIHRAAGQAHDPDTVVQLLKGQVKLWDDGKIYAIDEKGDRAVGDDGYITLDKQVEKLFKDKPFLAKPQGSPGSGSNGGVKPSPESPNGFQLPKGFQVTTNVAS